jgi:UDPglucose 6-dehydrogenase
MQITVVGLGYVGLVTATCLARLGQQVLGLESDERKLRLLEAGQAPYYEPHLQAELVQQQGEGRLTFTTDPAGALHRPDVVMICVGTPSRASGDANLDAVDSVVTSIGDHLERPTVVALRSTVPVGTTRRLERALNDRLAARSGPAGVPIFANPEFLRTGRALEDFLHPSRVILGRTEVAGDEDTERLETLYRPLEAPIFVLDTESAELVKNASNAYLATRISFVNEIAALCEATGASVEAVLQGVAADPRIGGEYLRPGIGYGGSCLPKDVRSLMAMGRDHGVRMRFAEAVDAVNADQPARAARRLADAIGGSLEGRRIGLLGLAFKAGTDDIRDSPALALAEALREAGATVAACDPEAAEASARVAPWIEMHDDPAEVARDADALVLSTDWPAYVTADLAPFRASMRGDLLFDARNAMDATAATAAGLRYLSVGRSEVAGS